MTPRSFFALPPHRSAKAAPERIDFDNTHFEKVAAALAATVASLTDQLAETRTRPARAGQEILERDLEAQRLSAQLRVLRRYSLDLCVGRAVPVDGSPAIYVGRVGLKDASGAPLLVDWRTPAAEPFFAATVANPMGLASRRRYRWNNGQVMDYWDETVTPGAAGPDIAPDDDSALLDTLAQARTSRMRNVLSTLAADQDSVIRADARHPLLVDGGPGTGKTVVALHRAAYLVYADPRLNRQGSNLLVLGPHQPYLSYIADVLPSLGEDSIQTATLADLVPEAKEATVEQDPAVAALKHSRHMVAAIEPAVALYEEPPTTTMIVETPWGTVKLTGQDWTDAFAAVAPGTPHNEARGDIWEELAEIIGSRLDGDEEPFDMDDVLMTIRADDELAETLSRAWPILDPADIVADLWEVPAYLRRCAPSLTVEERASLRRNDPRAWTDGDLPLLDAARHRLGDPRSDQRRAQARAARAERAREMDAVIEHLINDDDSEMQVMSMLRGADLQATLAEDDIPIAVADDLAGPFAHIIVDEAQELTDAQWAMVLRRCPSRSMTLLGDRAQARHGFTQTWAARLAEVGLERIEHRILSINYRTPTEVMSAAGPLIQAALPDANVPMSIRTSGIGIHYGSSAELSPIVEQWLAGHPEGTAAVITPTRWTGHVPSSSRVQTLTPLTAKGLEFDLVVLLHPSGLGGGVSGAVDRYVAMTRTTTQLVILDDPEQ